MIRECVIPGCKRTRVAIGRRGPNSPVTDDTSKRSAYCAFHHKGKGKAERQQWRIMQDQLNAA